MYSLHFRLYYIDLFFFFQAEDGIRDIGVTGVQTCALPICKHSLDYSGGVSAEDNFGIGGHDPVMGPNGQAQYWAPDLTGALDVLARHYDHTYRAPGERWPRPAGTTDPRDRDVRSFPHAHPASDFTTVGDVFSAEVNPERKKAFDRSEEHTSEL